MADDVSAALCTPLRDAAGHRCLRGDGKQRRGGIEQFEHREVHMGLEDKIKNAAEEVSGKAKEAMGKVTGDRDTEAEGKTDQSKSDLKQAGEHVKDAFN